MSQDPTSTVVTEQNSGLSESVTQAIENMAARHQDISEFSPATAAIAFGDLPGVSALEVVEVYELHYTAQLDLETQAASRSSLIYTGGGIFVLLLAFLFAYVKRAM